MKFIHLIISYLNSACYFNSLRSAILRLLSKFQLNCVEISFSLLTLFILIIALAIKVFAKHFSNFSWSKTTTVIFLFCNTQIPLGLETLILFSPLTNTSSLMQLAQPFWLSVKQRNSLWHLHFQRLIELFVLISILDCTSIKL